MEGFKTLGEALALASRSCSLWNSPDDGKYYNEEELAEVAIYCDTVAPLGDAYWYVVFPDGEIDMLSEIDKTIQQMFVAAEKKENTVEIQQSDQPVQAKFCMNCGAPLNEGAAFCSNCGTKL